MRSLRWVSVGWVVAVAGCAGPFGVTSAGAERAPLAPKVAVVEAVSGSVPILPAEAAQPRAPKPFPMQASPCPLKTSLKGPPGCTFVPEEGGVGGLVTRVERITCRVSRQTNFVGRGAETALSMHMSVVEANSASTVTFLRQPDGQVHLVPDALTEPVLWGGSLVGFTGGARHLAFWKDGVCEEPPDGWLSSLAPLSDDELVALLQRWDGTVEVLLRSRAGAWSSLGSIEAGVDVRLRSNGGLVGLEVQNRDVAREVGLRFPDLERAELVSRGRFSNPNPPLVEASPLPPRPGSRFGDAWVTQLEWVEGVLSVSRPVPGRGYQRTVVATNLVSERCRDDDRDPEYETRRADSSFREMSRPGVLGLSADRAVVAWVEQRGRCRWRRVPRGVTHCQPGEPCQPPRPASWAVDREVEDTRLVLFGVGGEPHEVLRVPLSARDDADAFAGLALAATDRQVLMQAWGHLVQLDRAKLEAVLR